MIDSPPDFPLLIQRLKDADETVKNTDTETALITIRKAVSVTTNVEDIITNLLAQDPIPTLRKYLFSPIDTFAFESSWILTNIASSTTLHCDALIDSGIYKDICSLLAHRSVDVVEQCSWAIGNIAGDSVKNRNLLLEEGVADTLCQSFQRPDATNTFKSNTAWAISNLCRSKPAPALQFLSPIFKLFEIILKDADVNKAEDIKWLPDVLWAISYISDGENDRIQYVIDHNLLGLTLRLFRATIAPPGLGESEVVPRRLPCEQLGEVMEYLSKEDLVRLATVCKDVFQTTICDNETLFSRLRSEFNFSIKELRVPTIRFIGNVVSGTDAQTALAMKLGVVELIESILNIGDLRDNERKELMWTMSNIVAGRREDCYAICAKPQIVKSISEVIKFGKRNVYKEAMWIISNMHGTAPMLLLDHMEDLTIPAIVSYLDESRADSDKSVLKDMMDTTRNNRQPSITMRTDAEKVRMSTAKGKFDATKARNGMTKFWRLIAIDIYAMNATPDQKLDEAVHQLRGCIEFKGEKKRRREEKNEDEESGEEWEEEEWEEDEEFDEEEAENKPVAIVPVVEKALEEDKDKLQKDISE